MEIGLSVATLAAILLLAVTLRTSRGRPAEAHSEPVAGLLTRDDVDALLTPFRTRLAALEAAVESQEGKIARARQLSVREQKEAERATLAEQLTAARAARTDRVAGSAPEPPGPQKIIPVRREA